MPETVPSHDPPRTAAQRGRPMTLEIPEEPRRTVAWVTLEEVPTAVVRYEGATMATVWQAFDGAFPAVMQALEQAGLTFDVPALAVYHGDPQATFDLDVGCTLREPLPEEVTVGELVVRPSHLAAGEYATLSHLGSYDGLGASWQTLVEDVRGGGAETEPRWLEVYVSDPTSTAPEDLRTDLFVQVVVTDTV